MAKPDKTDGYFQLAYELVASVLTADFTKAERYVLFEVFSQIYGKYKAETAVLKPSDIAKRSKIDITTISHAINDLVTAGVLERTDGRLYRYAKDYDRWNLAKRDEAVWSRKNARAADKPGSTIKKPVSFGDPAKTENWKNYLSYSPMICKHDRRDEASTPTNIDDESGENTVSKKLVHRPTIDLTEGQKVGPQTNSSPEQSWSTDQQKLVHRPTKGWSTDQVLPPPILYGDLENGDSSLPTDRAEQVPAKVGLDEVGLDSRPLLGGLAIPGSDSPEAIDLASRVAAKFGPGAGHLARAWCDDIPVEWIEVGFRRKVRGRSGMTEKRIIDFLGAIFDQWKMSGQCDLLSSVIDTSPAEPSPAASYGRPAAPARPTTDEKMARLVNSLNFLKNTTENNHGEGV